MKKIVSFLISLLTVICLIAPFQVGAFSGDEHNTYLRKVLFGETTVRNTDVLDALNDASELSIDQHNSDSQRVLDELRKEFGVKKIPKTVSKFNVGHGYLHRNYTHKGWTYDYKEQDGKDEAHWSDVRKKILLETINQKFSFGFLSGKFGQYNEQCDAFGALIYYVHVIGDHISNENYHNNYEEIPLVKGAGDYGIIEDLIKYSPILFKDIKDGNETYDAYISKLTDLKADIDDIYYNESDLSDPKVYEQYHGYAEELMQCMEDYIPLLIKREPFFQKVFFPDLVKL